MNRTYRNQKSKEIRKRNVLRNNGGTTIIEKTCTGCLRLLASHCFSLSGETKDGLRHRCKECVRAYRKQYYHANREYVLEQERVRRQSPHSVQHRKEYAERFRERLGTYRKEYHQRPEVKARNREYFKTYRKENPSQRVAHSLRILLNKVTRGKHKSQRALEFLGCDIHAFRAHLESQFQEGMSWDNYGLYGWHIDHVIPCSRFDLTNPSEQARCFHYSNMQPLWAIDNLRKHNKLPKELAA